MSKSTHQFEIRGVDASKGAFESVKSNAKATAGAVRSIVGGAIAAAGAFAGLRGIRESVAELGKLHDIAQRTGTDVGELTKATQGFSALGATNISIERFGKALDKMAQTTGKTGMAGFYDVVREIGKIPDVAERSQAAMKVFSETGLDLMPLINAADDSVEALQCVVDAMPAIPQEAADAGDAVNDAVGFAAQSVKSIWMEALGKVCGWFDDQYVGGIRGAALQAGNYLAYYARMGAAKAMTWFHKIIDGFTLLNKNVGNFIGGFIGTLYGGGSFKDALNMAVDQVWQDMRASMDYWDELDKIEEERTERFEQQFEDRKIAIEKFSASYDKVAAKLKRRGASARGAAETDAAERKQQIRNDLVAANSNEALKMQILGPQLQSETKKQTKLLERIAANTEETAANTDAAATEETGVF